MSKLWDKADQEDLELDRQWYRSKVDELSWALPVVRAAKAMLVDKLPLQIRMDRLADAVRAFEAAEKEATNG